MPTLRLQYCFGTLKIWVKHIKQDVLIFAEDNSEFLVS